MMVEQQERITWSLGKDVNITTPMADDTHSPSIMNCVGLRSDDRTRTNCRTQTMCLPENFDWRRISCNWTSLSNLGQINDRIKQLNATGILRMNSQKCNNQLTPSGLVHPHRPLGPVHSCSVDPNPSICLSIWTHRLLRRISTKALRSFSSFLSLTIPGLIQSVIHMLRSGRDFICLLIVRCLLQIKKRNILAIALFVHFQQQHQCTELCNCKCLGNGLGSSCGKTAFLRQLVLTDWLTD